MKSNSENMPGKGTSPSPGQFCGRTRREFLWEAGAGFTGIAMAAMLQQDGFFRKYAHAEGTPPDELTLLAPKPPSKSTCSQEISATKRQRHELRFKIQHKY